VQPKNIPELKSALVKIWDELITTRHNLQVDRKFQEASASLCKRGWQTF